MMIVKDGDRVRCRVAKAPVPRLRPSTIVSGVESLESRELLATFTVTNLHAFGSGSLRQAIVASNKQPGADAIDFDVAGTIRIGHTSLPSINGNLTINGSSAPGFTGSPVVTVNFQGSRGLNFAKGSAGSTLGSLSLVRAGCAGVTLTASNITVEGNYIGLLADGKTIAGNRGDGVRINATSHGDVIGRTNPVTSVNYYQAQYVYQSDGTAMPVSGWQGIRASGTNGQYLITGTSGSNGLLYIGPISGVGGTAYSVNYPGAATTSVYGPDLLSNGQLRLVGSYTTGNGQTQGFIFQGSLGDLSNSVLYRTIDFPNVTYTYIHSTMGDLAVGNGGDIPAQTDHAFLYSVSQDTILTPIVYPGSTTTSAYGIWYNGGTSYTICGGYSMPLEPGKAASGGYLVDYDSSTEQFTHWTSFTDPLGQSLATHFQGISSTEAGVYTLGANEAQPGSSTVLVGSVASVRRNPDGTFGPAVWTDLSDPAVQAPLTADAVEGNQVVGIGLTSSGIISYQATVNTGFQLSNVISGNGGNGIGLYGASGNTIAMNNIGTDASGTLARGNAKNGILVTSGASQNLIGGQATGGNDPTAEGGGVFVRPPQGNLISGNRGNGVLISAGATANVLSGNFVGTSASGNSALGNRADGAAIVHASGNQVIGCTYQQSPFVFYNVFSGNRGNGLRITSSNNTTVQANFMGVGANNATVVANGGNGLLVSGSSRNTQVGGVIPLGNVISGNNRNGIDVSGKASGLVSFNTFAGTVAFGGAAPNKQNGILVTSTGGNNLIRTCIISGNLGNGIEIGGNATGVQVTEAAVGTDSSIQTGIPNQGDGILITGHAHGNAIGGFQPSIEPQVTISSNGRYGVEIAGSAHDNMIVHSYVGTTGEGTGDLGNGLSGVYLGPGTRSTTIGGNASQLQNKIMNSLGNGVELRSTSHNILDGNQVISNQGYGVYATGACTGSVVRQNVTVANTLGNVNLSKSRGITYLP